jgi:hypothetical protein
MDSAQLRGKAIQPKTPRQILIRHKAHNLLGWALSFPIQNEVQT